MAGAFLHLIAPAYLIGLIADGLIHLRPDGDLAGALREALAFSIWFVPAFVAAGVILTLVAALIDPLLRKGARKADPRGLVDHIQVSAAKLQRLLTSTNGGAEREIADRLTRIANAAVTLGELEAAPFARDFGRLVETTTAALDQAIESRPAILASLTTALSHLETALDERIGDRQRLREGEARTAARYIELRYGPTDFSGGRP